ncbi:type II toxin-antitoxin system tRNA(fMet)-specific endonuclease VapC [Methylobacter svalbardensis]|uniref:type II toxin-antitoxin system tRNA(fMet)-specific endonuclease VapC n=1 Tax=Methylobacter svalbardensis TaxID=3080016 RepID=UPI0030EE416A
MIFMLDTNSCIYLLNRSIGYENILAKIDGLAYEQVVISSLTLAELKYGIAKSVKKEANRIKLEYFLYQFECLPFDTDATSCYGDIRVQLESKGTPIDPLDTLIAAHALSLSATMVTNNAREFECVEGLALENWIN